MCFFNIKDFDIEKIRGILYEKFKYRSQYEINFVMSHDYSMACFVEDLFFITDDYFVPKLIYHPNSLINSCAISDDGSIAICQTANNRENNDDSGAFTLIDINNQELIGKSEVATGWKKLTHLFLDSKNRIFYCYYDGIKVGYDFSFKPIDESQVDLYNKNFSEKILGLSLEERKKLQQQAIDEMGDDWQKELDAIDARNKARAGINEDTIKCDWLKRKKTAEERKKYFRSDARWALFESGVIQNDKDLERLYKTVDTKYGPRKVFKSLTELKNEGIIKK